MTRRRWRAAWRWAVAAALASQLHLTHAAGGDAASSASKLADCQKALGRTECEEAFSDKGPKSLSELSLFGLPSFFHKKTESTTGLLPSMMNPVAFPSREQLTTSTLTTTSNTRTRTTTTSTPLPSSTTHTVTKTSTSSASSSSSASTSTAKTASTSTTAVEAGNGNGGGNDEGRDSPKPGGANAGDGGVGYGPMHSAKCHWRILNVSYLGLISNQDLLYDFEAAIKRALAEEAGGTFLPDDVSLTLAAGSVIADAQIMGGSGELMRELQRRLNSSTTLESALVDKISTIPGLELVSMGHIGISHLTAPLPAEAATWPSFLRGPGRGGGWSDLWKSLLALLLIAVLGLCLVLLIPAMAPALHERMMHCLGRGGKVHRGVELQGHKDMLIVSSDTPRSFRSASSSAGGSTAKALRHGYQRVPGEFELVTVVDGGVYIEPIAGSAPPSGVPLVGHDPAALMHGLDTPGRWDDDPSRMVIFPHTPIHAAPHGYHMLSATSPTSAAGSLWRGHPN